MIYFLSVWIFAAGTWSRFDLPPQVVVFSSKRACELAGNLINERRPEPIEYVCEGVRTL